MTFTAAAEWARRHVDAERLPTAVLGIADASGVLFVDAFGTADGRAVRTDDTYRLFSVTKPLVGIAAARAIERGLLTPQTALTDALPEFGAARDDVVRLWHLASHTSGVTEPPLDTALPLRHELLARGRDFAAGAASRYSTMRSRASPPSSNTRPAGRGMPRSPTGPERSAPTGSPSTPTTRFPSPTPPRRA